jgi:hypothetical protein
MAGNLLSRHRWRVYSVPITGGPRFRTGAPVALFRVPVASERCYRQHLVRRFSGRQPLPASGRAGASELVSCRDAGLGVAREAEVTRLLRY